MTVHHVCAVPTACSWGHNRNALGVESAEVGVLEQTDQVSLAGLLGCQYRRGLEPELLLEFLLEHVLGHGR